MNRIILATAGMVEDGAGEMFRTLLLTAPIIPVSLLRDFSFHFSPWAFLQIPIIIAAVFFSAKWLRHTQTRFPARDIALVSAYMAATLITNLLLGSLM